MTDSAIAAPTFGVMASLRAAVAVAGLPDWLPVVELARIFPDRGTVHGWYSECHHQACPAHVRSSYRLDRQSCVEPICLRPEHLWTSPSHTLDWDLVLAEARAHVALLHAEKP